MDGEETVAREFGGRGLTALALDELTEKLPARIVVCGNLVQDILVRPVADPVAWGTTAAVEQISQQLGGNGGTTSYTLAKLGIPVTLLSLAGWDAVGDQLIDQLRVNGVQCAVERGSLPTSVSISLVDGLGRRALLYQLGASAGEFRWPGGWEGVTHLHVNAIYRMRDLRQRGAELLKSAKESGVSTSVDAQWDHLGEWPALPATDLLFVNEDEAKHLTGLRDPAAAALALRDHGAEEVVIKLGARGCFASTAEGDFYSDAFPAEVVDTTGAGDCFCGAYLAALHAGKGHREAARFANRIAAIAVGALGATAALDSDQFSSS